MVKYMEESEWSTLEHGKHISEVIRSGATINWKFKTSKGWGHTYGGGCCGSMPSSVGLDDPTLSSVIISLRTPSLQNPARHKWWWENILSKETSPWHECLPEEGATIYKSGVAWAYEVPVRYDMSFSNTINMFIATRQTMVEPHNTAYVEELYGKLKRLDDTVTFSEALACAIVAGGNYIMRTPQRFITGNGWLGTAGGFSPRHLAQRKFATTCGPNKRFLSRSYHPSCASWFNKEHTQAWYDFLESTVKKDTVVTEPFFKYNIYGNSLSASSVKSYTVDPLELLNFLRMEIK